MPKKKTTPYKLSPDGTTIFYFRVDGDLVDQFRQRATLMGHQPGEAGKRAIEAYIKQSDAILEMQKIAEKLA